MVKIEYVTYKGVDTPLYFVFIKYPTQKKWKSKKKKKKKYIAKKYLHKSLKSAFNSDAYIRK